jgi:hypothetical protein
LSLPPQPESNQQERIYLTTDGITSYHTKRAYELGFNQFIKITVKNQDLRALLDTKQSVIESKIIDHLTYLKDMQRLAYMSINTRLSGILRFFAMNDYHLNIKKIRRFLPENTSDRADRPYSIPEIQQIISQCDIRSRVIVLILCTMSSCNLATADKRNKR